MASGSVRRLLRVCAAAVVVAVVIGAPVQARAATTCSRVLTGATVKDLVVPAGAECILQDTLVKGDILQERQSDLFAIDVAVRGAVFAREANVTSIGGSTIRRNIELLDATDVEPIPRAIIGLHGNVIEKGDIVVSGGMLFGLGIDDNVVERGDVVVADNTISPEFFSFMFVLRNQIAGDVEILRNTGPGGKTVQANVVTGTLTCLDNGPFFTGAPNTASAFIGQCG
jgi:hypothetical protein